MKKAAMTHKEFECIVEETSSLLKGMLVPFTKGRSLSVEDATEL